MAKQDFKILDSDMHVIEPPDLWERYIDSKYRSKAPRNCAAYYAMQEKMSWYPILWETKRIGEDRSEFLPFIAGPLLA